MSNPILTVREKTLGVHGGISFTVTEAKAYQSFAEFDKVFVQDSSDVSLYGSYIFINDVTSIPDTSGTLINVTSGGYLINEKYFTPSVTTSIESQIKAQFPSYPISTYYNSEKNKFRVNYPNYDISDISTFGQYVIQVNKIEDFGSVSGDTVTVYNISQPTAYIVSESLDVTGYKFMVSSPVTITCYPNKAIYTSGDVSTDHLFYLSNGAYLTFSNVNTNTNRSLINGDATNAYFYIFGGVMGCKRIFTGSKVAALSIINASFYPNDPSIIKITDTDNLGASYIYVQNNYFELQTGCTFLDISNCHIDNLDISGNYIYNFVNDSYLINATGYTNIYGKRNFIGNNVIKGIYKDMTLGVSMTDYTWCFDNNFGANDLSDTAYLFVQSNSVSVFTNIPTLNTYVPTLHATANIFNVNLRGFEVLTPGNPSRIQIVSKSPYKRDQILTINLVIGTAPISQTFKFTVYKNGSPYIANLDISSYLFTNTTQCVTLQCPISHIDSDTFELYTTSVEDNNINLVIYKAQYSIQ